MMGLFGFFGALAAPLAARVLMALGMGVITIGGVAASADAIKALVVSNLSSGPLAAVQLAGLSGMWVALGMVFGAVTFAVTFATLTKLSGFVGRVGA
jgi:Protein of unknown function (DUF2523)